MSFWLSSPAFADDDRMPARYTEDGDDLSPPLAWSGVPEGTVSLALLMDDLDQHGGIKAHWVLFNLPPDLTGLPAGIPHTEQLVHHGGVQGRNDFDRIGYSGPYPMPDGAHRYRFSFYALDTLLPCKPGTRRQHVFDAMDGHFLGLAVLTPIYGRHRKQ
jgi:hypothetical protein